MDLLDNALTLKGEGLNQHTPSLPSGADFGQYRILRLLGRGGMGEVYEVEHRVLRRRYAFKLLPPQFAEQPGAVGRFESEARVMANLEHPNIVRVDDFGQTDGRYWLRMELAAEVRLADTPCVSLHDFAVAQGGRLPPEEVLAMLDQVLAGLAHAHAHGAIHRDLKPANILLFWKKEDLFLKISDFGLARLVGEEWMRSRIEASVRLSMGQSVEARLDNDATLHPDQGSSTRSLVGTYEYMSPEQKRGEPATIQSDLYAVGLMAFKLLTGRNPGAKPPSKIVAGLDPAWDDLLIQALEEDPAERYADAAAFLAALPKAARNDTSENSPHPRPPVRDIAPAGGATNRVADREPKAGAENVIDLGGGVTLPLVWCPAGSFTMGSPADETGRFSDEKQHRVTLSRGFWLGKTEVTQRQWQTVMGSNPAHFKGAGLDAPVETVSWDDCQKFVSKVNARISGGGFRLPTEAEWEYACRAGTTGAFTGTLDDMGWYDSNSGRTTHPVGQKKPNGWNLYDMHGNVWEWCADRYEGYPSGSVIDPAHPESAFCYRVLRGGSWDFNARSCRSANRNRYVPGGRGFSLGLRLARTPIP